MRPVSANHDSSMDDGQQVRDEAYRMVAELLVGFRRIVHRALVRVCGGEWFERGCPQQVRRRMLEQQEVERVVNRSSPDADDLFGQTRDWTRATAHYHSATPELGDAYQRRVAAVWPEEQKRAGTTPLMAQHVFSTNAFTANMWNTGPAPRPRGQAALPRTRL